MHAGTNYSFSKKELYKNSQSETKIENLKQKLVSRQFTVLIPKQHSLPGKQQLKTISMQVFAKIGSNQFFKQPTSLGCSVMLKICKIRTLLKI